MNEKEFEMLTQSIKQAGSIKKGKRRPSRKRKLQYPDIKRIRSELDVSQEEFALMIGVSARTLQNWEQGRREPDGPAKALLQVAAKNPKAILEALHA